MISLLLLLTRIFLIKVLSLQLPITLVLCPILLLIKLLCFADAIVLLFDILIGKYVICSCDLLESILFLLGRFLALSCIRMMLFSNFIELILDLFLRCIFAQTQTLVVIYIFIKLLSGKASKSCNPNSLDVLRVIFRQDLFHICF